MTIIGGDANRLSYQKAATQLNGSYSVSTCQLWTDRFEHTVDSYVKQTLKLNKDVNARTFHTISYEDLKYLKETIKGKVDLDPHVRAIREKDRDAHCPILVTIEPNEMTNQQKKSFVTNESKQQRAASRKEIQKANKAKGKARASQ